MLFNSVDFFIFFPIVLLVCFILPKKIRYLWLLLSSYYFYMNWDYRFVFLLLFTTLVTYLSALFIEKFRKTEEGKKRSSVAKLVMWIGVLLNLGLLGYFKYTMFFLDNLGMVMEKLGVKAKVPEWNIILPVGISFFIFQAISYLIDVYRGEIYVEKNFFRYGLFVSFFPQLVAGPIERSKNLLKQLAHAPVFCYRNIRAGFWLMLYGYFLKMILADRAAIYVDTVYGSYQEYPGIYLIIAAVLFSFQVYCDFYGYSVIALGAARMMGYHLIDNFRAPFFAVSGEDFWKRWHISLNGWFRDYLYIPLGGNRKGKVRQYINIIFVFFCSGLWHGANWTYVIWGLLNGGYQMVGRLMMPVRNLFVKVLGLKRETFSHRLYGRTVAFLLFTFSCIFFRAKSLREAVGIIKGIFSTWNPWILFDGSLLNCGLDGMNFLLLCISIGILMVADSYKNRKILLHEKIMAQEGWFRVMLAAGGILAILVLGIWGTGYDQAGFIYFQF